MGHASLGVCLLAFWPWSTSWWSVLGVVVLCSASLEVSVGLLFRPWHLRLGGVGLLALAPLGVELVSFFGSG